MKPAASPIRKTPSEPVMKSRRRRGRKTVQASVRPEEFVITDGGDVGVEGKVEFSTFLGLNTHYLVRLNTGERVEIIQESRIDDILEKGSTVRMTVKAEKINIFTQDGAKSLIV